MSFHLALHEPEIPANAGNVARLCSATATPLHLIGRLGFSFRHPQARRAVMDYWAGVEMHRHVNHDEFLAAVGTARVWAFTTHARRSVWEADFQVGDVLLFGPESQGLPRSVLEAAGERSVCIPMVGSARSLNLATAAAVGLYEALRQLRWAPETRPLVREKP